MDQDSRQKLETILVRMKKDVFDAIEEKETELDREMTDMEANYYLTGYFKHFAEIFESEVKTNYHMRNFGENLRNKRLS